MAPFDAALVASLFGPDWAGALPGQPMEDWCRDQEWDDVYGPPQRDDHHDLSLIHI